MLLSSATHDDEGSVLRSKIIQVVFVSLENRFDCELTTVICANLISLYNFTEAKVLYEYAGSQLVVAVLFSSQLANSASP